MAHKSPLEKIKKIKQGLASRNTRIEKRNETIRLHFVRGYHLERKRSDFLRQELSEQFTLGERQLNKILTGLAYKPAKYQPYLKLLNVLDADGEPTL